MVKTFEQDGLQFKYPDNWQLDRETTESGWTAFVQSPNTAFFMLTYDSTAPAPEQMLQSSLQALREVYEEIEFYDRIETIAHQPAFGYDMQFTSLDLTNSCFARSFYAGEGTVLLMWQATDLDLEETEPVFRAICTSLTVSEP